MTRPGPLLSWGGRKGLCVCTCVCSEARRGASVHSLGQPPRDTWNSPLSALGVPVCNRGRSSSSEGVASLEPHLRPRKKVWRAAQSSGHLVGYQPGPGHLAPKVQGQCPLWGGGPLCEERGPDPCLGGSSH